jgi:hypothetical protein
MVGIMPDGIVVSPGSCVNVHVKLGMTIIIWLEVGLIVGHLFFTHHQVLLKDV